jgi:hypothetical protein
MRRKHLVALAVLFPLSAMAGRTTVVLVGTTPTTMPKAIGRQGMLIENRGPNPIYCSFSATVTVATGHTVAASGGTLPFNGADQWYCIAGTAQESGAGTVVSEV